MDKSKDGTINDLADRYIETRSDKDFANLFNRLRPGLINHVQNILKDSDATEDVVADAFVKIWNKIDTYNPLWCFSTWSYRITRNEALQYIRKKKKTVSIDSYVNFVGSSDEVPDLMIWDSDVTNSLITMPVDIDNTPTQEEVSDAIYQNVMAQMENLPAHYKDIIIDREVHEMQYDEIAAKYNLQLNTVKTRIIRAREKIMLMADLGERKSKARTKKNKAEKAAVQE